MAKIVMETQEKEVEDGGKITNVCEDMGIVFGCRTGLCQTCRIKVLEGAENLSELTDVELDAGLDKETRLACQCTLKSGMIKIKEY